MQRAVSVVRLALSLMWRSQQKQHIRFYNTVVLELIELIDAIFAQIPGCHKVKEN
jgi:hypothetical protein